jgi:hypothetical protein
MKSLSFIILSIILSYFLKWERHYYKEYSFSIEFPGKVLGGSIGFTQDISTNDSIGGLFKLSVWKIETRFPRNSSKTDSIETCINKQYKPFMVGKKSTLPRKNWTKNIKFIKPTFMCINNMRAVDSEYSYKGGYCFMRCFIYKDNFIVLEWDTCIIEDIEKYKYAKNYFFNSIIFY